MAPGSHCFGKNHQEIDIYIQTKYIPHLLWAGTTQSTKDNVSPTFYKQLPDRALRDTSVTQVVNNLVMKIGSYHWNKFRKCFLKQSGTGFITVGLFTDLNRLIHLFAASAKCIYPRALFSETYFLRFNWTSMIQGTEFGKNCYRLSVKWWWRPGAVFLFRKWPSGFLSLGVSMSLLIDPYPRVYELLQRCLLVTRLSMLSVSYVTSHYIS